MAPHNTGKSTTALHLIRAGFALVSDSMVHVVPATAPPLLAGFPTRRIKLRADMLGAFPEFHDHISTEIVRDETKYVVDLTQVDPHFCITEAVEAADVTLCLLERTDGPDTTWQPASPDAVMTAVMHNSLFYDTWPVWEKNLAAIERLLAGARPTSCASAAIRPRWWRRWRRCGALRVGRLVKRHPVCAPQRPKYHLRPGQTTPAGLHHTFVVGKNKAMIVSDARK